MSFDINMGPVVSSHANINSFLGASVGKFYVGHLNCQSIRPSPNSVKFDELKSILSGSRFDIFAISETWLKPVVSSKAVSIPGYKFYRNDRENMRGGGVGVYVSNTIRHKVIFRAFALGKCESLFLELCSGSTKLLFGVVYLPPVGDPESFEELHYNLLLNYTKVIIVGDFNCDLFNLSRSALLRSLCTRLNLSIVHNSRPTHYSVGHRTTSLIDFMLVGENSMTYHSNQVQCPSISHHALIFCSFDFDFASCEEMIEFRDYENIDWDGLLQCLSVFDSASFFYSSDANDLSERVALLFGSLFTFVPVVRRRIRRYGEEWMKSRDVLDAQFLRDLSFTAFRQENTPENWRIFCRYRNKAKSIIRRERRKHYSKHFGNLDAKGFWRFIKGSGCFNDDTFNYDGDVNTLNNFFATSVQSGQGFNVDFQSFQDFENSFSFRCVHVDDISAALARITARSVGVDGIPIKFLKLLFPYTSDIIQHLFNSILMTSEFPSSWKTARVVPIPKTSVIHSPEDLRPISILPVLSKVFEHVLKEQLMMSTRRKIFDSQYAFRSGHNTTSLLLHLTESIRNDINNGKVSALLSLDLTKAFNSICFGTMIDKLRRNFGFSRSACKLVMSYMFGRTQFVDLNGIRSEVISLSSGVPQGSVLGPLLFILYINDFSEFLGPSLCNTFLFADDIYLLFSADRDSGSLLESNINTCINRILLWSSLNSLSINPSKTKAILFGSQVQSGFEIFVQNSRLAFVDRLRCLGVTIDRDLNFGIHIDIVHSRVYGILRRLYSAGIYLPLRVKARLAHALLMPQILYGLEVVSGTFDYNLQKLNRIMNTVVRFVYNVRVRDHISRFVRDFLGTSFRRYVDLRNTIFFYKVVKSGVPVPLCGYFNFSRSSRSTHIILPRIFRSIFERSFTVRVARCWNLLPAELRIFSHSNNVFRLKLIAFFASDST